MSTLLPKLLPRLDGTRTVDDLVDRLGRAARPAVEGALQTLAEHGLLVEGPPASGPARRSAHALAAAYGQAPSTVAGRLEAATIGVVGSGADGFDVARLLKLAGVGTVERSSWSRATDAHLAVVVPDAHELDRVRRWNEVALRRGLRWLPVRPFDGRMAAIGPLRPPRRIGLLRMPSAPPRGQSRFRRRPRRCRGRTVGGDGGRRGRGMGGRRRSPRRPAVRRRRRHGRCGSHVRS